MKTNALGVVQVTKVLLPLIRKSRGRIVNVSSILGRRPCATTSDYAMTKTSIETFSTCLRLEMKRFGVTVCVVQPGNFILATKIGRGNDTAPLSNSWHSLDKSIQQDYGSEPHEQLERFYISLLKRSVSLKVSKSRLN